VWAAVSTLKYFSFLDLGVPIPSFLTHLLFSHKHHSPYFLHILIKYRFFNFDFCFLWVKTYARSDAVGEAIVPSKSNNKDDLNLEELLDIEISSPISRNNRSQDRSDGGTVSPPSNKAGSSLLSASGVVPASHSQANQLYNNAHAAAHSPFFHHHHHHTVPVAGLPQSSTISSATLRRQARAKPAQIPRYS
jgi:hypothetical protein